MEMADCYVWMAIGKIMRMSCEGGPSHRDVRWNCMCISVVVCVRIMVRVSCDVHSHVICVCAMSFSFATNKSHHRACYDDVTHELSEERPEEHAPRIGAEYAQGNGYGGAKDGQEGEQGYP